MRVCVRVFDETYIEPKAETRRKEEVNEEEKGGGREGGRRTGTRRYVRE